MNFQRKMNACSILSNADWTKRGNAPLFSSKCTMPSPAAPPRLWGRRIFIIHHRQQKVNRQTAQKIMLRISRNCATFQQKVLDFRRRWWYTVYRSQERDAERLQKDFEKNRKNLLTNSARYNIIGTEVKGKRFLKRRKATVKKLPKNFKKPLDKPSEKCYNESTKKSNEP